MFTSMRRGFTLIETLVALILLEIGMLALAATSAVAARDLAIAHRRTRAQTLARNQLELLRANPCAATGGVTLLPDGYEIRWTVESTGQRRGLTVLVLFALPGGRPHTITLRSATACP